MIHLKQEGLAVPCILYFNYWVDSEMRKPHFPKDDAIMEESK